MQKTKTQLKHENIFLLTIEKLIILLKDSSNTIDSFEIATKIEELSGKIVMLYE